MMHAPGPTAEACLTVLVTGGAGSENGATVMDVIEAARRETNAPISVRVEGRRPGDPAVLVANCEFARRVLGWSPKHSGLATIVQDAWRWERSRAASSGA